MSQVNKETSSTQKVDAEIAIKALKDGEWDNPKLKEVGYLFPEEDKNIQLINEYYLLT